MEDYEMDNPVSSMVLDDGVDAAPSALDVLDEYIGMKNIAEMETFPTEDEGVELTLPQIGQQVLDDFRYDKESRKEWEDRNETGLKLARQIKDNRSYAGEAIADVKYPTIASAAIQYAARAYPAIVKDAEVVKFRVIGSDPKGEKAARGARIAQYQNYVMLEQMDDWDESMDIMLFLQPIVGTFFKKTYYDPIEQKPVSELVHPEDLVVYYLSKSFESAARKTHILYFTQNDYVERVRSGEFIDLELPKPSEADDGMHTFLEQHRTLDLDGDGYEEPYVVTVHESTGKVARIAARFERQNIITAEDDKSVIVRIKGKEHFTDFPFMPSFDGGVYGMGFGILLGPINESINTLFNQLLDAGTRANFQSGFIGRGVRLLRGGETGTVKFKRGEWKIVQATGDDLRKSVYPLPATEPSAVLFQLLGFLVQAAKELASQSDLLAGQQEQHNVPATSTLALIEQGLKVFSGIYKRMYRSLKKEYRKINHICAQHVTQKEYVNIVDDQQANIADFVTKDCDVVPVSTAESVTETQKYMKAQALMQVTGKGLDDMEINKFYLESLGVPNIDRFMPKGPAPPDPQFTIAMRELDIREKDLELKWAEFRLKDTETAAKIREMRERGAKLRADAMESLAKAESMEPGEQLTFYQSKVEDFLGRIFELEQAETALKAQIAAMQPPPPPAGPQQGQPPMQPGQPPMQPGQPPAPQGPPPQQMGGQ